jgi:adenine-specific DNA methylase
MNAWVSFVVGSSLLLKVNGRIGFVLPAEILQVSYAKELREFLATFFNKINIISFKKLVFPSIQQEVVLLLCEKNKSEHHLIEHIEVNDADSLTNLNLEKLRNPTKRIDFKTNKWTFYFLDQLEIDFLEDILDNAKIPTIGNFSKVEVGITTGANPYFTVNQSTVNAYNLHEYAKPMVGRSVQVKSLIFNKQDWIDNNNSGARSNILIFPSIEEIKNNNNAIDYIEKGIESGIPNGYKCGIRDEWQIIPSTKLSDALFIRRNNIYPRLILNCANAYTTDTMHRVWINKGIEKETFVASYYNSISLAFAEVAGRSHGGGVLELMPSEAESILLPFNENNKELVSYIDKQLRKNIPIETILNSTNKLILQENYSFTEKEIQLADNIRKKLSLRRIRRGKPNY